MKNIDNMIVGDFLYLLDCMQEECDEYRNCSDCKYDNFCDRNVPYIDTLSIKENVEGYAEANGLLEHMRYVDDQKWIPVSEYLPKEYVPVNVTWINRNPEPYYEKIKNVHFSDTAVYCNGRWFWWSATCVDLLKEYGKNDIDLVDKDIDVIAWMPLPKPFEGEHK